MEEGVERRTNHVISGDLDANPDFYHINIVYSKEAALQNLKDGRMLSMSVNMENYNIYIGSDHLDMQRKHAVPDDNFCAGYIRFDRETKRAIVEDLTDWRDGTNDISGVKKAIETAFDRDIGKQIF